MTAISEEMVEAAAEAIFLARYDGTPVPHGSFKDDCPEGSKDAYRDQARAAITAYLSSLEAAGYVVVSKTVSDEMKHAYGEAVYYTTDTRLLPENIWNAMINASKA